MGFKSLTIAALLLVLSASAAYAKPGPGAGSHGPAAKPIKPAKPAKGPKGKPAKVTLCHRTDDPAHPFLLITVSEKALPAHLAHGDVAPALDGTCPVAPTTTTDDEDTSGETPVDDDGTTEQVG